MDSGSQGPIQPASSAQEGARGEVRTSRDEGSQLLRVLDALPLLVSQLDVDLNHVFVNQAYARWFQRAPERIRGNGLKDLLGSRGFATIEPYLVRALKGEQVTFSARLGNGDGSEHLLSGSLVPERRATGEVSGLVMSLMDGSAQSRGAAESRASSFEDVTREHLATLARAGAKLAESLDYETTLQAIPRLATPALGDMCLFEIIEENDARKHFAHAHGDERRQDLLNAARWETLNLREAVHMQPFVHNQVDDVWIEQATRSPEQAALLRSLAFRSVMQVPLESRGQVLGSLTWFRKAEADRTHTPLDLQLGEELARRVVAALENARLFQEARDAVGIRDDFLSIAGHELRTPLTALQLQVLSIERMLKGEIDADKIRARAEKAARNVVRLSTLVNELLDISRISAGRLTLQQSQFDLSEPVFEVLGRMADDLVRARCTIDVKLEGELRGSWDRLRIEQIVTNLVSNAAKYGEGKPIEVRLSPRAGRACLSVRDFGVGISPEDQKRIFERFERAVPSRHTWGLGLGLWIARQLIEAHGGTIRVESEPGAGATFEVELALEHTGAST